MLSRTRKAFTLLELIVVVVVLGILALIAVPTFATVITNSAQAAADSTAGVIARNANAIAAFDASSTTFANITASAAEVTPGTGLTIDSTASTTQVKVTVSKAGRTASACVGVSGGIADVVACA